MAEYISTFTTGFSRIVKDRLPDDLPGGKVLAVYDGLIHYRYDGDFHAMQKVVYLNNTFCVLASFCGEELTFPRMVRDSCRKKQAFPISRGTYRVRFSKENQFAKAEKAVVREAEKHIEQCSDLKPDRVSPQTEIWYMIRSEGVGFYCQLLFRREATEKDLHQGELRPEFAFLLCACGEFSRGAVVCDPCCGHGAIPRQLLLHFPVGRVLASDIDAEQIAALKKAPWAQSEKLSLSVADATRLEEIASASADAVITDPPWGFYEDMGDIRLFYRQLLPELDRIVKPGGRMVILSARKQELEAAAEEAGLPAAERIDTLVNGKKAGVFLWRKERS